MAAFPKTTFPRLCHFFLRVSPFTVQPGLPLPQLLHAPAPWRRDAQFARAMAARLDTKKTLRQIVSSKKPGSTRGVFFLMKSQERGNKTVKTSSQ